MIIGYIIKKVHQYISTPFVLNVGNLDIMKTNAPESLYVNKATKCINCSENHSAIHEAAKPRKRKSEYE